jgi:hypothetical protein
MPNKQGIDASQQTALDAVRQALDGLLSAGDALLVSLATTTYSRGCKRAFSARCVDASK